jgi:hypothetical protein
VTAPARASGGIAIRTAGLAKTYTGPRGEVPAVLGLDLEIADDELFGLLGPNGAGKSTTVGMLTTLVVPSSGTALVCGLDVVRRPVEVKRRIGGRRSAADPGDVRPRAAADDDARLRLLPMDRVAAHPLAAVRGAGQPDGLRQRGAARRAHPQLAHMSTVVLIVVLVIGAVRLCLLATAAFTRRVLG